MISVHKLSKRYGNTVALDGISFEVPKGEILGLLGPNGAGKTTTMNILSCCLAPDSGTVRVGGIDVTESPVTVTGKIGYLPEIPALYEDMRVIPFLGFAADIKGVANSDKEKRLQFALESTGLAEKGKSLISTLSKGYRQRLGLATAILHDPEVLILDEPTIGLDPNQIVEIRNLIRCLAGDHTVILSTHILSEVQLLCQRAAIINDGKIAAVDTIESLQELEKGTQIVTLETEGPTDTIEASLQGMAGIASVEKPVPGGTEHLWRIHALEGSDIRSNIFRKAAADGWVILEMQQKQQSLEDVFARLTTEQESGK